jgi:hypothetical protein
MTAVSRRSPWSDLTGCRQRSSTLHEWTPPAWPTAAMSAVEPVEAEQQAMRIREPELGLSSIRWQRQTAGMERDQLPTTDGSGCMFWRVPDRHVWGLGSP